MDIKCPICGAKTTLRTSKQDGSKFHVCANYPYCKGRVAFEDEWEDEPSADKDEKVSATPQQETQAVGSRLSRPASPLGSQRTSSGIKYYGAHVVSTILLILGAAFLIFGLTGTIVIAVHLADSPYATTSDILQVIITYGLVTIVYSLMLFAAAFGLDILRGIEKNTRDTTDFLKERSNKHE